MADRLTTQGGSFGGRHALVASADGGVGLAVAKAYLDEGARCTVVDLRAAPPPELQALIDAPPETGVMR